MVQRRHQDLDIWVPVIEVILVVVLARAEDTGEALVGVELIRPREDGMSLPTMPLTVVLIPRNPKMRLICSKMKLVILRMSLML
jgi:hypothetical protein